MGSVIGSGLSVGSPCAGDKAAASVGEKMDPGADADPPAFASFGISGTGMGSASGAPGGGSAAHSSAADTGRLPASAAAANAALNRDRVRMAGQPSPKGRQAGGTVLPDAGNRS